MANPISPLDTAAKIDFLNKVLQPIPNGIKLKTVNSVGASMTGEFRDPDLEPKYFSLYAATMFTIPTRVHGIFLISHPLQANGKPDYMSYHFHGEISHNDFEKVYPGKYQEMVGSAWSKGLVIVVIGVVVAAAFALFKR